MILSDILVSIWRSAIRIVPVEPLVKPCLVQILSLSPLLCISPTLIAGIVFNAGTNEFLSRLFVRRTLT